MARKLRTSPSSQILADRRCVSSDSGWMEQYSVLIPAQPPSGSSGPLKGTQRGTVARFSKKPNSGAVAARGVAGAAPNVGRQLGAVARRVREGQGLTLTDVATTAGISAGMLSRLETGHVTPSLETLVALSAALGVPPAPLLPEGGGGGEGAPKGPAGPGLPVGPRGTQRGATPHPRAA